MLNRVFMEKVNGEPQGASCWLLKAVFNPRYLFSLGQRRFWFAGETNADGGPSAGEE